jgi:outer membrane protein OmpA-like peptidoglycan-associated protein
MQWNVQGGGFGCQATGGDFSGLGLALLALTYLSRRRAARGDESKSSSGKNDVDSRSTGAGNLGLYEAIKLRHRSHIAPVLALVGVVTLGASPAHAQTQSSSVSRTFLLERFTPQAGDGDVLGVQSPSISAHLLPRVMLWGSYADVPLRAVRLSDDGVQQMLAANQTTLTLAGSLGLLGRVEFGLAVPVVITQSVGAPSIDAGLSSGGGQVSLGDVRVQAKTRLFDVGAFTFGASLPVTLPTAGSAPYAGSSGVTATPTLLAQWSGPRRSSVLVDLGVVLRQPQQLLNLTVGNAMTWSVAGKIDLLPRHDLSAMVSAGGELGLVGAGAAQNPLEALVALRWMPIKGLALTLGAGPGLSSGYGTPRFRVVASIGWVPPERELPAHPPQSQAADQMLRDPLPPVVVAEPVKEEVVVQEPQPVAAALEAPAPRVIPTLDKVYFETGRAEVQRTSLRVLDDVARVMTENPSIAKVRIEAHTDNAAPAQFNDRLSTARAAWVREYLIAHGVAASRLESEGFGLRRPIADNSSLEGRTANRRVEFVIVAE